jgi:hypothetical protein
MRPNSLHSARRQFATIERFRRMSAVSVTGLTHVQNAPVLREKPKFFVPAVPFNKGTAQDIKCLRRSLLQPGVHVIDYSAIRFSKQQIVAAGIDRQLRAGRGDHLAERLVPCLDGFDAGYRHQLLTIPGL